MTMVWRLYPAEQIDCALRNQRGFCLSCGKMLETIPACAARWQCAVCGEAEVFGAGQMVLMGLVSAE
jgi:hypothetical protein